MNLAIYTPACLPPANDNTAFDGKMALAVGIFLYFFLSPRLGPRFRFLVSMLCLYGIRVASMDLSIILLSIRHFFVPKPLEECLRRLELYLYGIRELTSASPRT